VTQSHDHSDAKALDMCALAAEKTAFKRLNAEISRRLVVNVKTVSVFKVHIFCVLYLIFCYSSCAISYLITSIYGNL